MLSPLNFSLFTLGFLFVGIVDATSSTNPSDLAQFFDSEVLDAERVKADISEDPNAPFWVSRKSRFFSMHPQLTVRLNDLEANRDSEKPSSRVFTAKAVHNRKKIAVWLEWEDSEQSLLSAEEVKSHGDSFAVQFPWKFDASDRLPHVGMGDEKAPVVVHVQRVGENGYSQRSYTGRGFGSLTRNSLPFPVMKMTYLEKEKKWRALLVRDLGLKSHRLRGSLLPISFAFWDGGKLQRGGNKYLSSWKFMRLKGEPDDQALIERNAFGFRRGDLGDPEKGKALVAQLCVSCHWVNDYRTATPFMAPDLSGVGVVSTYSYLKASISNPNEVVVRNLHLNRHYNRSAEPDENRAFPNREELQWYVNLGAGQKMSKMPNLGLTDSDISDVISYLKPRDANLE